MKHRPLAQRFWEKVDIAPDVVTIYHDGKPKFTIDRQGVRSSPGTLGSLAEALDVTPSRLIDPREAEVA